MELPPRRTRMEYPPQDFRRRTDSPFLLPPPIAMPSLSTGQGFYTVESLQGTSFVPPPHIGPPLPPPFLPPLEPFLEERSLSRAAGFHPINRGAPFPLDRDLYSPPSFAMPRPPFRGPPPHFLSDSRSPGFQGELFPDRIRPPWALRPHRPFNRKRQDMLRDRSHPRQQPKMRKQVPKKAIVEENESGIASEHDVAGSSANVKKGTTAVGPGWCHICQINCHTAESLKKHLAGKRHKKQLESEKDVEKPSHTENEMRKPDEDDRVQKDIMGKSSAGSEFDEDTMRKSSEEDQVQLNVLEITSEGNVEETEIIADMNEQVDLTVTAGATKTVVDQVVDDIMGEERNAMQAAGLNEVDVAGQITSSCENLLSGEIAITWKSETLGSGEDGTTTSSELVSKETDKGKVDVSINAANASASVEIQILGNSDDIKSCEEKERDNDLFDLQANTALRGNKRSSNDCADLSNLCKKPHTPASPGFQEKNESFRQVCELCHVTCTSKRMLETHLKTKRHAANLKKTAGSSVNIKQKQGGRPSGRLKKG